MKSCPVKYKAIIPFNSKEKDEMIILMKYAHNHDRKELHNSKARGILQKVKDLIEPLLINRVKSTKVFKILEEYVKNKLIKKEEL